MKSQEKKDKIATYIARFLVCCIGILLVIIFVILKIWKTANFEQLMVFGAMIGLCLGYGLGGDIWGARLFGLFTHLNTKGLTKQELAKQNETPFVRFMAKAILFIAIGFAVFFSTILVIAFRNRSAMH